jgi:hypothetical protein
MARADGVRRVVAEDGRRYLAGEISWDEFIDRHGESHDDDDVAALVDLIEHEPQRCGFLGLSEPAWVAYRHQIEHVLRTLESS